jgi:hypothetical protein
MRRFLPVSVLSLALLLMAFAVPVGARPRYPGGPGWDRPPDLSGTWFLKGRRDAPCEIDQRGPDEALFINENGSEAWGSIRGDRVWIPDWSDGFGSYGLEGRIRGDRIIWPDGSFWSRRPMR